MTRPIEEEPERKIQLGPKSYMITYPNCPSADKRYRAYLRAASVQQEHSGAIIANQETKIRQYIAEDGVLVASYVDNGIFSDDETREGFKRLYNDTQPDETIIVSHRSRLGRDPFVVNDIILDLWEKDIDVVSVSEDQVFHAGEFTL